MSLTEEEKHIIQLEARQDAFTMGIEAGRTLADQIDAAIYTRDDMTDLSKAGVYALEYVRAFMEGLERAFKHRADDNDRMRYDVGVNKQRKTQKEQHS